MYEKERKEERMVVREEKKVQRIVESESESEREGTTRVPRNKSYSGVLQGTGNMTAKKTRTPWKSPENKMTTVETRVSLKEGMGEEKSVKTIVLEKLKNTNVETVEGI